MINIDACVKYAQNTAEDLKSSVEYEANWCIRHNLKRCPDHFERFLVENKLAK